MYRHRVLNGKGEDRIEACGETKAYEKMSKMVTTQLAVLENIASERMRRGKLNE